MVELVWDQRRAGTATTLAGRSLVVGEQADFSPEEILAIAVAACLMRTSVRIAAESGVELLSFTAAAKFEDPSIPNRIHVRAHMVTSDAVPEVRTRDVWSRAVRDSSVACLLGDRLVPELEVTRLAGADLRRT